MEYRWDPEKDIDNRRKHGMSLADGIPALEDPDAEEWIDERFDYGEERIITLGLNQGRILFVVSTQITAAEARIISVRKAEKHEQRWHIEGHPQSR